MNKSIIYTILLAGVLLLPTEVNDLGKMKPVETVFIYIEGNQVVVETDTEDMGQGADVHRAIENLKETTSGTIYLDTADYLLVGEGTEYLIPQIAGYLKDRVKLCAAQREVKVMEAASYLSVHNPKVELKAYENGKELERLCVENGRLILKKN